MMFDCMHTDAESDMKDESVLPSSEEFFLRERHKQNAVSPKAVVAGGSGNIPGITTTEPPADGEETHTENSVSPKKGQGKKRQRKEGTKLKKTA